MNVFHKGNISLKLSFSQAWELIYKKGGIDLVTKRERTPFQTEAKITTRGRYKGERVIIFYQKEEEYARSYPCCWGHDENCNRTWIGMYCKAIDNFLDRLK